MKNTLLTLLVLALVACAPVATNNDTNDTKNLTPTPSSDLVLTPVLEENASTPVETTEPAQEDFAAHLTFTEGDLIQLKTLAVDPDQDDVELEFSKPFDRNGVWQTQTGDAGDYPVTVNARDSKGASVAQRILVTIQFANRAPVLEGPDSITVREGEQISLDFSATDPDEDEVIMSYSGWMKGNSYTTTYDDAGQHEVTVSAEDGKLSSKKVVTVNVENVNRPPQIVTVADRYETVEMESVTIDAAATDADGDDVTITFGAPLDAKGTWTPALDQAGEYTVTITANDGTDSVTKDVLLVVTPANRAPSVIVPTQDGVISVNEGDVVDLRNLLQIEDPEGEEVTVRYDGWMQTSTYQTTYEDAGRYSVKVTASDESNHVTESTVIVVVADVNRPPVFVRPA
jgi:hypothetical protein